MMISACVSVISNLSSSSLFLIPFMLTCSMLRFISPLLFGMCACVVSVVVWASLVCLCNCLGTLCLCANCDAYTVVCVACVYAERVRGCECDGNAGLGPGGGEDAVSAGCVYMYMGSRRGSGVVPSADDVLQMSVVRGVRGVGIVCEMCIAWNWV